MAVKVDGLEVSVKSTVTGLNSFKSLQATVVKLASAVEQLTTSLPKMAKQQDKSAKSSDALNKQMTKMESGTKKLSAATKKAEGPLAKIGAGFSKIVKSIGRIAFYRAVRSALRAVTGAFKEGVENLYQWSKAGEDNGKFAASMDKIATAVKYLKNALATLVAPLINAAAPTIDAIIDKIVEGINKINEFIARIRGDDFWYKAVKVPVEFAEGTKEATAAVKDFMMGWDELNVINDSKGGSGSAAESVLDMFDTEKTENPDAGSSLWSKIKARVTNIFETVKTKWDELGIGDKIDSFIQDTLPQLAQIAADVLTIIAWIASVVLPTPIANALDTIHDFVDLIDALRSGDIWRAMVDAWKVVLDIVESVLLPLFGTIDLILGTDTQGWWHGVIADAKTGLEGRGEESKKAAQDTWDTLLKEIKWRSVEDQLKKSWRDSQTADTFGQYVAKTLIKAILQKLVDKFKESSLGKMLTFFREVKKALKSKYKETFETTDKAEGFGDWFGKQVLLGMLKGFLSACSELTKNTTLGKAFSSFFKEFKKAYDADTTSETTFKHIASSIVTAIATQLKSKIKEKVAKWTSPFTVFATVFKKAWSDSKKSTDIGDNVGESVWDAIIAWWNQTPVAKLGDAISAAFSAAFEQVKKLLPDWVKWLFGIEESGSDSTRPPSASRGKGPLPDLYANGGTPNTGSLFWAGEAGPELVDQVGGRSTVYNAGQLAQELSVANGNVVGAIYGMRDAVVGAIAAKDTTVRISGGDIGRANAEYQRKRGVYVNTGAFANAY